MVVNKRKRLPDQAVGGPPKKKMKTLPPLQNAKLTRKTSLGSETFVDPRNMPKVIVINQNIFTLGRAGSNTVILRNFKDVAFRECHISSSHAEFLWMRNSKWMIRNKGTNGMLINGELLEKNHTASLTGGDELIFGRDKFKTKKYGMVQNRAVYQFDWENKKKEEVSDLDRRLEQAKRDELERKTKEQQLALKKAQDLAAKAEQRQLENEKKALELIRKEKEQQLALDKARDLEEKAKQQKLKIEQEALRMEAQKKDFEEETRKKQKELEEESKRKKEDLERIEKQKQEELAQKEKEKMEALEEAKQLAEQAKAKQMEVDREKNEVQAQQARIKEENRLLARRKSELQQQEKTIHEQNKELSEKERKQKSEKQKLIELHECPLCCDFMFLPISTKCGHTFCKKCIWEIQISRKKPTCPVCRQRLKIHPAILYGLKSTIQDVLLPAASELEREEYEEKKEEHLEWLRAHKLHKR